jgi:hypothetical protein
MNILAKAKGLLVEPGKTWDSIAAEPMTLGGVFAGYVLPLAAIPSIASAIGTGRQRGRKRQDRKAKRRAQPKRVPVHGNNLTRFSRSVQFGERICIVWRDSKNAPRRCRVMPRT